MTQKRSFVMGFALVSVLVATIALCGTLAHSIPLLDNKSITTSINVSIAHPIKGKFSEPIWASSGRSFLSGGRWIDLLDGELKERETIDLGKSLEAFGWIPEEGKIFALKTEEGNNDICIYDMASRTYAIIPLPVRKSWRKVRILDPSLTSDGKVLAIFQKETSDKNVKECYMFIMDREGKAFKELTDNSIFLIKSKFLFMGNKEACGKLRFPRCSNDGKHIAYLSLTDPTPQKLTYELCITKRASRSSRTILQEISHPGPPAWSPDGSAIAIKCTGENGEAQVIVVTPSGEMLSRIPVGSSGGRGEFFMDGVSWSFDGEWISFSGSDGQSIIVTSKKGDSHFVVSQLKQAEEKSSDSLTSPCWSPTELNLIYLQNNLLKNEVISLIYLARITR